MDTKLKPYVSVTQGIRGWFAVLLHHSDGIWEPWSTGIGSYETREGAIVEAKDRAASEGLEYRD